ncbi:hypothetical protein Tco_0398500 [Tanacetum coccineum]
MDMYKNTPKRKISKKQEIPADLPLDRFLNCPSSLEVDRRLSVTANTEEVNEKEEDIDRTIRVILGRCKDICVDSGKKTVGKKSISFLLKKIFVCSSGFPTIPSLRDPLPESRMEKILRAMLKNKINPQHSQASSGRKKGLMNFLIRKVDHILDPITLMASSPLIHIFWDIENIKSANINESIRQLLKVLSQMIPGIEIEITAYGDRKELTEQQRKDFLRNNVDLFDIPHQGGKRKNGEKDKNDADRKIMTEMFSFAFKNPHPAYIMLISGDSDFYRSLTSLSTLGYSTVLVYAEGHASNSLKRCSDFSIAWKKISKGIWEGPVMYLKERTMAPQQDMQIVNGVFWDMETAQLAKTVSHDKANNYLFVKVMKSYKFREYKAYGEKGDFPRNAHCCKRKTGVQYILTSSLARQKKDHIENRMIADIMTFAYLYRPPTNIFVLTRNVKLAGMILSLKNKGYKMIVGLPLSTTRAEARLLRNAATEITIENAACNENVSNDFNDCGEYPRKATLASDPLGVLGCARTLVVRGVDAEAADAESSSSLLT